jgi:hypothetical protein
MCDNLNDVFISDEEESQPKIKKTKIQKQIKPRIIRRSNFIQVRKINETQYQNWIKINFTKIHQFFKKVNLDKKFLKIFKILP